MPVIFTIVVNVDEQSSVIIHMRPTKSLLVKSVWIVCVGITFGKIKV